MILWFQLVMQGWLWALLGLVLLGFPQQFCRGTSGEMMCETRDRCVPAQRWPRTLPTGAGPGQRTLLTSLVPTTPQGFKNLSPSFLTCHNLGSMSGLRHLKWFVEASWKQREEEGVPAHSRGIWSRWSSNPNHIRILRRLKGLIDHLKCRLCSHLPSDEAMGEIFLSLLVVFMEMSLFTRYKQMQLKQVSTVTCWKSIYLWP